MGGLCEEGFSVSGREWITRDRGEWRRLVETVVKSYKEEGENKSTTGIGASLTTDNREKDESNIIFKTYICNKNNICHNTDPCGTPLKTDFSFQISPSTITLYLQSINHFSVDYANPTFSLSNTIW